MRLYQHPMSFNARRAVMTAIHLDLDVEIVTVPLEKGAQHDPAFVRMNPNGKVPVLEDGGFCLWESHAIMQYLAGVAGAKGERVYPKALKARARVERWLFWSAHELSPALGTLNWERNIKRVLGLGEADPAIDARGVTQVASLLPVLDAWVAENAWLAGDDLTLADLAVATPFMIRQAVELDIGAFPRLQRWLGRVEALDAWKKTGI